MIKSLVIPALVAASLPVMAVANPVDNYAQDQILAARYTAAIAQLEAQRRASPTDESALLNLALAYRQTGRAAEAAKLYRRVLQLDDAKVDTAKGKAVWSHDVARAALAATPVTLTMR